jgi:hypothetical protein
VISPVLSRPHCRDTWRRTPAGFRNAVAALKLPVGALSAMGGLLPAAVIQAYQDWPAHD